MGRTLAVFSMESRATEVEPVLLKTVKYPVHTMFPSDSAIRL